MVERYNIYPYDQYSTDDRTSPTGAWVRYEDYEALEAQLAAARKDVRMSSFVGEGYAILEHRLKAAEQALATARGFVRDFASRALSDEHAPDELWLIDHDSLKHKWNCDITEARRMLALLDHPAPAPTPSLDDAVVAALEWAANEVDCGGCGGTCADPSNCNAEDARIIRAAASDPDTIAAIIKTAGGKKDE